jgi:hypothetical protein
MQWDRSDATKAKPSSIQINLGRPRESGMQEKGSIKLPIQKIGQFHS